MAKITSLCSYSLQNLTNMLTASDITRLSMTGSHTLKAVLLSTTDLCCTIDPSQHTNVPKFKYGDSIFTRHRPNRWPSIVAEMTNLKSFTLEYAFPLTFNPAVPIIFHQLPKSLTSITGTVRDFLVRFKDALELDPSLLPQLRRISIAVVENVEINVYSSPFIQLLTRRPLLEHLSIVDLRYLGYSNINDFLRTDIQIAHFPPNLTSLELSPSFRLVPSPDFERLPQSLETLYLHTNVLYPDTFPSGLTFLTVAGFGHLSEEDARRLPRGLLRFDTKYMVDKYPSKCVEVIKALPQTLTSVAFGSRLCDAAIEHLPKSLTAGGFSQEYNFGDDLGAQKHHGVSRLRMHARKFGHHFPCPPSEVDLIFHSRSHTSTRGGIDTNVVRLDVCFGQDGHLAQDILYNLPHNLEELSLETDDVNGSVELQITEEMAKSFPRSLRSLCASDLPFVSDAALFLLPQLVSLNLLNVEISLTFIQNLPRSIRSLHIELKRSVDFYQSEIIDIFHALPPLLYHLAFGAVHYSANILRVTDQTMYALPRHLISLQFSRCDQLTCEALEGLPTSVASLLMDYVEPPWFKKHIIV